ncbi:hypothetical protein EH221_07040 [bacterium]|nr:MAG: hypothetical protein EH221_07040 [bacterium]
MKWLMVILVFVVMVGCSKDDGMVSPEMSAKIQPKPTLQPMDPGISFVPESDLMKTTYRIGEYDSLGYVMYAAPFKDRYTDLVVIVRELNGLIDVQTFYRHKYQFTVSGNELKLKATGDWRDIQSVYIHGVF